MDIIFRRSTCLSPRTLVCEHYCAEGAAGEVLYGRYADRPVAIKVYRESVDAERFLGELAVMLSVRHPNVVRLLGAFIVYGQRIAVTEFAANGDLYTFLRGGQLADATRIRMATDIASGLRALHRVGVIHGDVKSLNVLVDEWWRLKLADFSLSIALPRDVDAVKSKRSLHGTPCWLAPELLTEARMLSAASDVYSLGIVLWEVATSRAPFDDDMFAADIESLRHAIVTLRRRPHYRPTNATQRQLYALMQQCWHHDASERPTAARVRARLRRLGTIEDATAHAFWTRTFGDGVRYVAWNDFWPNYLASLGAAPAFIDATKYDAPQHLLPSAAAAVRAGASLVEALAVFLCDERARVWQRRFGLVIDTFAPTCGIDLLTELVVLASRSWFRGVCGRARAQRTTDDYSVRLSPVAPALFFLTLRTDSGRIRHVPIHRLGRHSFLFRGRHYSSLGQCLPAAKVGRGGAPRPCARLA